MNLDSETISTIETSCNKIFEVGDFILRTVAIILSVIVTIDKIIGLCYKACTFLLIKMPEDKSRAKIMLG